MCLSEPVERGVAEAARHLRDLTNDLLKKPVAP